MFRASKTRVESLRFMDSRHMQKQGVFNECKGQYYKYHWSDAKTKEEKASIAYTYDNNLLTLSYKGNGKSFDYSIQIDRTPCNYGGTRPWFICPISGCNKRVARLYIGSSLIFACRHCNNANYAIQQMAKKDIPLHHMHKIRDKLGWEYHHVPNYKRWFPPKHMHTKTFKAIVDKHDDYERQVLAGYQAFFDRMDKLAEKYG